MMLWNRDFTTFARLTTIKEMAQNVTHIFLKITKLRQISLFELNRIYFKTSILEKCISESHLKFPVVRKNVWQPHSRKWITKWVISFSMTKTETVRVLSQILNWEISSNMSLILINRIKQSFDFQHRHFQKVIILNVCLN